MTRVWLWLLGGILAVALVFALGEGLTVTVEDGSTPLVVVCLVTEEGSRKPVAEAKIHVHSEMKGDADLVLITDGAGFANRFYPEVGWSTRRMWFGLRDRWSCQIPAWGPLWVTATGYETKEIDGLRGLVTPLRERSEMPTLVVRISLKKLPVKGGAP